MLSLNINQKDIKFPYSTFYKKPEIGINIQENQPPSLIVFPSGGILIGSTKDPQNNPSSNQDVNLDQNNTFVSSGPEATEIDLNQIKALKLGFLVLAIVNLVITFFLYFKAETVDVSKVENPSGPLPSVFERVSNKRRNVEQVNFSFTVILILLGSFSILTDSLLGISAYSLSILLNFVLGTASLPYFVYSFRYILDFLMFYIALVYRSRISFSFLPIHLSSRQ